jgi:integrase
MTAKEDYTESERNLAEELTKYLTDEEKLDKRVVHEYVRISLNFVRFAKVPEGVNLTDEQRDAYTKAKLKEFLNIENTHTYRNSLAALKKLFNFMTCGEMLESYKFKKAMPNFSIKSPSLKEMVDFGKALSNNRIQVYFYLGVVSGIRPAHLRRLTKELFDTDNRMINTWMPTFGRKNFFFSFYTEETKQLIEDYLKEIPDNGLLFPLGYRRIEFLFEKASERCGTWITPKMMRKFFTNWVSRHGMNQMDVDAITSHLSHRVVATNYVDNAILVLRDEYDKATKELKLLS